MRLCIFTLQSTSNAISSTSIILKASETISSLFLLNKIGIFTQIQNHDKATFLKEKEMEKSPQNALFTNVYFLPF